jgi:hypothetical protein
MATKSAATSLASATTSKSSPTKSIPKAASRLTEKDKEKEKMLPMLINQLRERIKDVQPLPDEPDFFSSDETLVRFIRAREYHVKEAEKQIRHTIEWRRKFKPLDSMCSECAKKPGLHSMVN